VDWRNIVLASRKKSLSLIMYKYDAELEMRTCSLLNINDITDLIGKSIDVNEFDKAMISNTHKKVKRLRNSQYV
jgi:hypothetical protein